VSAAAQEHEGRPILGIVSSSKNGFSIRTAAGVLDANFNFTLYKYALSRATGDNAFELYDDGGNYPLAWIEGPDPDGTLRSVYYSFEERLSQAYERERVAEHAKALNKIARQFATRYDGNVTMVPDPSGRKVTIMVADYEIVVEIRHVDTGDPRDDGHDALFVNGVEFPVPSR